MYTVSVTHECFLEVEYVVAIVFLSIFSGLCHTVVHPFVTIVSDTARVDSIKQLKPFLELLKQEEG